jgi:DNA repair protein RadC
MENSEKFYRILSLKQELVAEAPKMKGPNYVKEYFSFLKELPHEEFWVALLGNKHEILGITKVSQGVTNQSIVHPREVFRIAVRECATAIITVHNHPSGDTTPSPEDKDCFDRLNTSGKLLGIPVLDNVIV